MQYRELIYEIYEEICGSRLTTNMGRIGGFERNFTNTAFEKLEKFLKEYPDVLKEFENLFTRNRIFMDRTIGTGPYQCRTSIELWIHRTQSCVPPAWIMMFAYIRLIPVMKILNLKFLSEKPAIVMIVSWFATRKCGSH